MEVDNKFTNAVSATTTTTPNKTRTATSTTTTTMATQTLSTAATCDNVVTCCGNGGSFNYATRLNHTITPGTYLHTESTVTANTANTCCQICADDEVCLEFSYNCNTRQCQLYKAPGTFLDLAQVQHIAYHVVTQSNGYVAGFLWPINSEPEMRWNGEDYLLATTLTLTTAGL
jgi:hypothetical protein